MKQIITVRLHTKLRLGLEQGPLRVDWLTTNKLWTNLFHPNLFIGDIETDEFLNRIA